MTINISITMKQLLLVVLFFVAGFCDDEEAVECVPSACLAEEGCFCSTTTPVITNPPQFVIITTDDAVTPYTFTNYFDVILSNRKNPDGNPIGATLFVPHEYSDYHLVNELYNRGYEIALNSISKNALSSYWAQADLETLTEEFSGERDLIAHFANIPKGDIIGARTPNLQLRGNITFEAYVQSGLKYDNSWPTQTNNLLYPYTLDYLSTQQCAVGICPNASFPGFWIAPIVNIQGQDGSDCNVLFGCNVNGTTEDIFEWMQGEFHRTYDGNKAPLTLLINSAWFDFLEGSLEAAEMFLDYLGSLDDVYLTSVSNVINYMQNPVNYTDYRTVVPSRNASCTARTCVLDFSATEIRYMNSCAACPAVYPWLGNPLGEAT